MTNMTISNAASTVTTAASSGSSPRQVSLPDVPDVSPSPVPAAPPVPQKTVEPQLEQVQQAIDRVKESIKPTLANSLDFQIDQSTGKTIVKIMDTTTNTLVRQIPSEEMLIIAKALTDLQGRGGLVKGQA